MIKVLIVDDSNVIKKIIKELLEFDENIKVVGFASNGLEACEKTYELNPDVVIMDLKMPVYDGIYGLKRIMATKPTPVIILSAVEELSDIEEQIKKDGALSVMKKPKGFDYREIRNKITKDVKSFSNLIKSGSYSYVFDKDKKENKNFKAKILCIGSSTGGPDALIKVFKNIDKDLNIPVVVIQHITSGFNKSIVGWIQAHTKMKVKIAEENEKPQKNTIYIPEENHNLILNKQVNFSLAPVDLHPFICPCIDISFKSINSMYKGSTLGVILTGMGKDGADGMEEIHKSGGYTIAQDEKSSVVFGMPKEAIRRNAVNSILDINNIGKHISEMCN